MKKRSSFKIVLATIMTIFNLFVCFSGVIAWFAAARQNDASGMQVQILNTTLDMDYKVYKYNQATEQIEDYTHKSDEFDLITYDSILTERNNHTPIIVEFTISGSIVNDQLPVTLEVTCANDSLRDRYLSNIIGLRFSQINTITDADTIPEKYNKAINFFNGTSELIFEPIDTNRKSTTIEYTETNYSANEIKLFMMLNYSQTLIESRGFIVNDIMNELTPFVKDLREISCNA